MSDRKLKEEQLIELRRLATDADGENWRALDYYDLNTDREAFMVETRDRGRESFIAGGAAEWNAQYIAAADPGTILALLDRLDALLDGLSGA